MSEISQERWQSAQSAEMQYWLGVDAGELLRICAEKPPFLANLGDALCDALFAGKSVLEVGTGPLGISLASFYPRKSSISRLVKIDPLPRLPLSETALAQAGWAPQLLAWAESLSDEGEYRQMPGEEMAVEAEFDTVITYNVLDHVRAPETILGQMMRALRPGGRILVGVDCLSVLGRIKFEQYYRRKGGPGPEAHPYSFLPEHVVAMMERAGFRNLRSFGVPGALRRFAGSHFRPAFVGEKPAAP